MIIKKKWCLKISLHISKKKFAYEIQIIIQKIIIQI